MAVVGAAAGGGAETASAEDTAGPGKGHGKAAAPGQNKHGASDIAATGDVESIGTKKHGATASMLGGLNSWTHASANARLNASPNSQVGLAASYEQALLGGDVEAAIESLLEAANKEVTDETQAQAVVESIHAALDIAVVETTEAAEVTEDPEATETTEETEETEVTETTEETEETEVAETTEEPETTEQTEVAEDTETIEETETVQSRTISQETMDAVVEGFLAGDSTIGETEADDTTEGEEVTAEAEDPATDGSTDDGTLTSPSS
jgi:hypothetical protein